MLGWAGSMTWKGIQPVVTLSRKVYEKGVGLSKKAMAAVEKRLERNPLLPKWDSSGSLDAMSFLGNYLKRGRYLSRQKHPGPRRVLAVCRIQQVPLFKIGKSG